MIDVLNLALPYFGLIFLGLACGRLKQIPDTGLAWMNFFIVYVALPCLFYRIVARTPLEELANVWFVVATSVSTTIAFFIAFAHRECSAAAPCPRRPLRASPAATAISAIWARGWRSRHSAAGGGAGGADLLFRQHRAVHAGAIPDGDRRRRAARLLALGAVRKCRRIALHPFIIATLLGVLSAALHFQPPVALDRLMQFLQNAAAPCALFVLGVTVALRPLPKLPWDVPADRAGEARAAPADRCSSCWPARAVQRGPGPTAVLMAALPPALNVFVLGAPI
jgi:malonate transporter and related proteins